MTDEKTICVICAWRQTCNKKFLMDGASTTRCPDFTRDVTLKKVDDSEEQNAEKTK
jgi:hypothetical protein